MYLIHKYSNYCLTNVVFGLFQDSYGWNKNPKNRVYFIASRAKEKLFIFMLKFLNNNCNYACPTKKKKLQLCVG